MDKGRCFYNIGGFVQSHNKSLERLGSGEYSLIEDTIYVTVAQSEWVFGRYLQGWYVHVM